MCDKTNKIESKCEHLKNLTYNEFNECIEIKHTIENPDFFDIDEIFDDYNLCQIKKIDSYLVKYDFNLVLENEISCPH